MEYLLRVIILIIYQDFVSRGCPNCESLIAFKSDDGLIQECTSPCK